MKELVQLRLNFLRLIKQVSDNMQVLMDVDFNEFDFISSEDKQN
jgi:hypothetical protein